MSANNCTEIASESGLGGFTPIELEKLSSGKIAWAYAWLGEHNENMGGSTSVQDMEFFLQKIHLMFTQPSFSERGFNSFLQKQKTWYENLKRNYWWINQIVDFYSLGVDLQDINFIEIIKGLKKEDIKDAASKFLQENNKAEFILLPKK
ncbi:MAG: hypothetical protein KKA07_14185 [Bacteroidetes bacterium]|nr:hypothetical protein [Bacteroidota bacterium]MBU1720211.1 hypothetical protein [Bacteroidota bacterium]